VSTRVCNVSQCVAMSCSVFQCIAVCVAVRCSIFHISREWRWSTCVLQCVAVFNSALQSVVACVAVCYDMLQCVFV